MSRIRLVEFTRAFHVGGTETQVVELLRGLPRDTYETQVAVLDEEGALLESVWRLGHLPVSFPLKGSVAKPNTALQVAKLAFWLAQNRIQLIHVHDFYATVLAVPAAKLAQCKVIVGRLDLAHWHGRGRRRLLRWLTSQADHVVANSNAVRAMLETEERLPRDRISVIPNGLDVARFDERAAGALEAPLPDTEGAPVVVHVANMNHEVKRQEDLLEALSKLRRQGMNLHAFLVGEGPRRPLLESLAKDLGVSDRAHFLGARADVPALLQRATLGVLCSSAEGLPNAAIECMAAGLPMVVTRAGGTPELIREGHTGLVVAACRPTELAAAMGALLQDLDRAKAMGEAGRAFVRANLSLGSLVRRHDAMYRRVVGSSAGVDPAASEERLEAWASAPT